MPVRVLFSLALRGAGRGGRGGPRRTALNPCASAIRGRYLVYSAAGRCGSARRPAGIGCGGITFVIRRQFLYERGLAGLPATGLCRCRGAPTCARAGRGTGDLWRRQSCLSPKRGKPSNDHFSFSRVATVTTRVFWRHV